MLFDKKNYKKFENIVLTGCTFLQTEVSNASHLTHTHFHVR